MIQLHFINTLGKRSGKTNCIESKVLREEIIESCFAEAYQILCKNNKDVIKRFLERIENLLSDDKIKNAIRKLQEQRIQMETKLDSLLNLMIDGTIDKEIFTNKREFARFMGWVRRKAGAKTA